MAVAFLLLVCGCVVATAGLTADSGVFIVVGAVLLAAGAYALTRTGRRGGGDR